MKLTTLCALAAVLLAGNTFAAESFLGTHAPMFWHGGEFPGAKGRAEVVQDELRLHYDFSGVLVAGAPEGEADRLRGQPARLD